MFLELHAANVQKKQACAEMNSPTPLENKDFPALAVPRLCAVKKQPDGSPKPVKIHWETIISGVCGPCQTMSFQVAIDATPYTPTNIHWETLRIPYVS